MGWNRRDIAILERALPKEKYIRRYSDAECLSVHLTSPLNQEELIIVYWERHHVYLVWDATLHKKLFTATTHSLSAGKECCDYIQKCESSAKGRKRLDYTIRSFTKRLSGGRTEIVALVGAHSLKEYCDHYAEYDPFPRTDDRANGSDIEQESTAVHRRKRNPIFRQGVLEKYNYTCRICGCKEPTLLQAAHIKSVAAGGTDDISNGCCLCANHHVLFDAGLLSINQETCHPTGEIRSDWNKESAQREISLWMPNDPKTGVIGSLIAKEPVKMENRGVH